MTPVALWMTSHNAVGTARQSNGGGARNGHDAANASWGRGLEVLPRLQLFTIVFLHVPKR